MKVLIVDDEELIRNIIKEYCNSEGYSTDEAENGLVAIEKVKDNEYDIIILDLMMPKLDGYSAYSEIKALKNIPTIILSARSEEADKLLGFNLGVDDYLTKPFSPKELMARIKANLRKSEIKSEQFNNKNEQSKDENKIIAIGDLVLDLEKIEAKVKGKIIDLTLREFEVLKYLAMQNGQVVTREKLLEAVWGYEYYGDIRTVDVTVRRIRGKIEKDTSAPKILATKRGIGYYIKTEQSEN